jgi:hypothetical protein
MLWKVPPLVRSIVQTKIHNCEVCKPGKTERSWANRFGVRHRYTSFWEDPMGSVNIDVARALERRENSNELEI